MRSLRVVTMGMSTILVGFIIGCGGGGGGDAPKAKLTAKDVDTLGSSAAKMLPGCEYNSDDVAFAHMDEQVLGSYRMLRKEVLLFNKKNKVPLMARSVHIVDTGGCGGTLTKEGTHENGDEHLTYTYDHYCSGDATKQTVVDGVVSVEKDQTPTASGPKLNSMTMNTQGGGLTTTNKANGETTTQSLVMKNVVYTAAKGSTPATLAVGKIKTTDSKGKVFELTGAEIETKGASDELPTAITVKKATYKDPDIGLVSVKTTPLSDSGPATITISGSEGTAEFKTTDSSTGMFTATMDGKTVGGLDCSAATAK